MNDTVIKIDNLSKQYRLGEFGTGTLSHDLQHWWNKIRGKDDYYIDHENNFNQVNDVPDKIWALDDLNLEIKQGEVLGIIGKNGAGKSTLLKLISRITIPTSGSIRIKGRIASLLEVGTGMHHEMTARENIYLNGAILGMKRHEITKKFDEIIDFSGIDKFVDTPVKRFSSGMMTRLGFAVAAHLEPEILVVDEVLAVGDIEFQRKCLEKMDDISSEGRTVLFVSHNMTSIEKLCNRVLWLSNGKLRMDDNPVNAISGYLSDSDRKENAVVDLENLERNKLIFPVFKKISLLSKDNEPANQLRMGDSLKVVLELEKNKKLSDVNFGFGFEDATGRRIFSISNLMVDGAALNIDTSINSKIELKLKSINLLPGDYFISISVVKSKTEYIDSIDQAIKFKVAPADVYGTGNLPGKLQGVVYVDAEFEV